MKTKLPDGWQDVAISDVATVVTGKTPSTQRPEYYGGSVPFVAPGDFNGTKYIDTAAKMLSDEGAAQSPVIPAGSTLFTCIGLIGKTGIAARELRTNQQINSVIPTAVDGEYLYYALTHASERIKHGAAKHVVPILNKSTFSKERIPLPPLAEQKAIASMLQKWSDAIEKTESLIAAKQKQFKWLIRKLIDEQDKNAHRPKGWREATLGEVCDINATALSNETASDYTFSYMALADVSKGDLLSTTTCKFSEAPMAARMVVKQGDVLLATVRPYLRNFYIVRKPVKDLIASMGFCVLTPDQSKLVPAYLYHCLYSDRMMQYFLKFNVGTSYPTIKAANIKQDFTIPLPALSEQERIADILETAQLEVSLLKRMTDKYRIQQQGLMQKLLAGKWRVAA